MMKGVFDLPYISGSLTYDASLYFDYTDDGVIINYVDLSPQEGPYYCERFEVSHFHPFVIQQWEKELMRQKALYDPDLDWCTPMLLRRLA